jgi:glutaconate CoA-transferase subunit B
MSTICSVAELAAALPSGSSVAIGGFQLNRVPMAMLAEIVRAGIGELRVVSVPNPLALDLLVAHGRVRAAEGGFIGFQYEDGFVMPLSLRRALQEGGIDYRERDVLDTITELRRAAEGAAPGPDFALIHAQAADEAGNLRIDDPHADLLLAAASGSVLATAERIVPRLESPTIAGDRVAALAECPGGAAPTGCVGRYRRDPDALRAYLQAAPADLLSILGDARERAGAAPASSPVARPRPLAGGRRAHSRAPSDAREAGSARVAAPERRPARGSIAEPGEAGGGSAGHGPGTDPAEEPAPEKRGTEAADLFVVLMARQVRDGDTVVTGLASALPMLAIELARRTHAPRLRYINCVGAVDPRLRTALPVSVDAELLADCAATITLPELFDLAAAGGIDTMFFGAAQIDAGGAINLTRIGRRDAEPVKLPGPAGSPSMRSLVRRALITVPRQSRRTLVAEVDVPTSVPSPTNLETVVITDLAIWALAGGALQPRSLHPGVSGARLAEATGFGFTPAACPTTMPPRQAELNALAGLDPDGLRHRLFDKRSGGRAAVRQARSAPSRPPSPATGAPPETRPSATEATGAPPETRPSATEATGALPETRPSATERITHER